VFVELEDGFTYTLVIATPKNIEFLMNKENMEFFEPGASIYPCSKINQGDY
jgi:hypothetical protein